MSDSVIVAKIENEIKKNEIMRNKLKGDRIYTENDLSWEERKIQEKIRKWATEQKSKGKEIKIGIGKVKMGERWKRWAEIEKEKEAREEEGIGETGAKDERREEQNFV